MKQQSRYARWRPARAGRRRGQALQGRCAAPAVSRLWVISSLLWLAGCATLFAPPPSAEQIDRDWQARQSRLQDVDTWELKGRLAMRADDDGWHASLRWQRQQDRHVIDLSGPLGKGHVRLNQDASGARLRDNEQQTHYASTARQLLYETTGWDLPLDDLNYWVLGLPAPDSPKRWELDDGGRLKTLQQGGWEVRFLAYGRHGDYDLPSKVFIQRDPAGAAAAADSKQTLEVRLAIAQWTVSTP